MNTLSIDFKNSSTQKPAFYQSDEPSQNVLTLTVSNNTGSAVTFTAGTTKLRIGFGRLLSAAEANAISIVDPGWSIVQDVTSASRGSAIVLSPKDSVQLSNNASLSLIVTVPSIAEQPASGNLTILYTGVTGINDDETVLRFFILKPPTGKPAIPLNKGWLSSMPSVVYVSPDPNHYLASSLGIFLSNTSDSPLADPKITGHNPRFLISFPTIARPDPHNPVPDPGMNALTNDDLAKDIWMHVIGDGHNQWSLSPSYGSSNQSLVWEMKPLTPGILGGGQSVEIIIDHIRTALPPFITYLHIQYLDIPGYDDGIFTLQLEKTLPSPGIMSFYSDTTNIEYGDTISLIWNTFAITDVELSYSVDGKTIVKSSKDNDIQLNEAGYKLKLNQTTIFTLTAYDSSGQQHFQKQLSVTVNQLEVTMGIQPLTVAKGETVKLTWKVSGSDQDTCLLEPGNINLSLSGTDHPLIVNETTSYAITAYNSKRVPSYLSEQKTVTVMPASINSFTCSPNEIVEANSPVVLSWKTQYASRIKLEPSVDLDPPITTHPLQDSDSRTVRPHDNTTYTLTVEGLNGPIQNQVAVQVHSAEIVSFTIEKDTSPSPKPGLAVLIKWETKWADRVKINGVPCRPIDSFAYRPCMDDTHTLTCEGPNGSVSKTLSIPHEFWPWNKGVLVESTVSSYAGQMAPLIPHSTLTIDLKNRTTNKPAFYQTNDPSQNVLTLTVSNYTSGAVTFSAGTSKIRIGFGTLLSAAEVNAITISDAGWTIAPDNTPRGSAVVISPKDTAVPLGGNASLSLTITVPSVAEQPTSGNLTISYVEVAGADDDETVLRYFILKPPSGKPAIPLAAGWQSSMPAIVYVSPDPNNYLASSLGLFLSNKSDTPLADSNAAGSNPRFLISFPTVPRPDPNNPLPDPAMNALTYDDLAADIWMRFIGDGINDWQLSPAYGSSNESLVWELKPLSPGILGGGQSVNVMIDHIRTILPPFTTAIHVQYLDIPGYDDGIITLHLQKTNPSPGIMSFYSDSPNIDLGDSASLNWSTFAVTSLELSYSVDAQTIVKSSDNGDFSLQQSGYKLSIDQPTTFTLTAVAATGESIQKQLTITVNELEVSMIIQPLTIAKGATVKMAWKVTGSDQDTCRLDPLNKQLPLSGTDYPLNPQDEKTTYTITAYNSKRNPSEVVAQTTVTMMPVHINQFSASPSSNVEAGSPVLLSWNVDFPSTIKVEPAADLDPPVDTHPLMPIDGRTVRPRNNTTYTLTADGLNGPIKGQASVSVNSVAIKSFTVSPNNTQPGAPATLSWVTSEAVKASLTGQSEITLPSGSVTVNPRRDTTYTLTCDGPNGPVSQSVTLETQCVKINSLWGTCIEEQQGYCLWSGAHIQVKWDVTNATSTLLLDLSTGLPVATISGAFVFIQKNGTLRYRLIAYGPEGPVMQDLEWYHNDND